MTDPGTPVSANNIAEGSFNEPGWILIADSDRETVYVRAWKPGDGVTCSHAGAQRKFDCGRPVFSKTVVTKRSRCIGAATSRPYWQDNRRRFVVCINHLATHFGMSSTELSAASEKRAREKVLAEHWDEYISTLAAERLALRDEQLMHLPESVRAILAETSDGGVS